jgi:Na+/H+ antiporter NhaD/arsenite permease-like protein
MNDTLAIIGTPVVLLLAKKHGLPPKLLLLTLCYAITTGSAMSPIGNPQNLLIAINGNFANPFLTFFKFLALPTLLNMFLVYLLLKLFFKEQFHSIPLTHSQEPIRDHHLAIISKYSLLLLMLLVAARILITFSDITVDFRLSYIALLTALPILLLSPKRAKILRNLDWHTLIFFSSMFVIMQSVWNSLFFQTLIKEHHLNLTSNSSILTISVLMSQIISNVPLVALYLPVLEHAGTTTEQLIALAAGSTIAGNLFILGAASNVIIIQNAEKRSHATLTFLEFAKIGIPLTSLNIIVYWLFLILI